MILSYIYIYIIYELLVLRVISKLFLSGPEGSSLVSPPAAPPHMGRLLFDLQRHDLRELLPLHRPHGRPPSGGEKGRNAAKQATKRAREAPLFCKKPPSLETSAANCLLRLGHFALHPLPDLLLSLARLPTQLRLRRLQHGHLQVARHHLAARRVARAEP